MRTRSTVLVALAAVTVVAVGGAGTAYAARYQDQALPGTTVGGVSVAGMTRAELTEVVRQRAADVTLTLGVGDRTRTVHLDDLGYAVDVDATVDAVFAANESWSSYATSLVSDRRVDAVVRPDAAATDRMVSELVTLADKQGRDAGVRLAPDKKSFVVTPASVGQTVDRTGLQDAAAISARTLSSARATVAFVDLVPRVTTPAAQEVADRANAIVERRVSISDGDEEHKASRKTKAGWVRIPTSDGVLGNPSIDAEKVRSWVEDVAEETEVTARAGTRNVSASGKVLTVVTPARDGAVVTNAAEVAKAAVRSLDAGRNFAGTFEYDTIPATWTERRLARGAERLVYPATDGEKWIDVNLAKHTMTAYVGATVVYGPIAMVNGSDEKPTVVGTFHVYYKNPLMTMRGSNADGTNYETPNVPWSSFFHRGYALHGAPWRSSFGYSGSHGCVNLPVSVAKWVYDFAPIGTPVVTHF